MYKLFLPVFLLLFLIACGKKEAMIVNNQPTSKTYYDHKKFVMGADLSFLTAMTDNKAVFYHQGKQENPYDLFKTIGTNCVRVRLWHTPHWQKPLYGAIKYNHLPDVMSIMEEAKRRKMAIMLDLHYSDDWADPSRQDIPAAWKNLPIDILKDSIYQYTRSVLQTLQAHNLTPEYVQIGNEINNGMCAPQGSIVNQDFSNLSILLKSGIKAVRDFSLTSDIKPIIVLHIAQLHNAAWWLNGITQKGITDYDVIGISHYYKWANIHSMADITSSISTLKTTFNKQVMIVETAFPWTVQSNDHYQNILANQGNLTGYEVNQHGQSEYMEALVQAVIHGGGNGVIYWEPAWVSTSTFKDRWGTGSSWENCAFFDFTNNTLPVVDYLTFNYKF
jgi:arabinogalactan endo-1,4-beta-galactosidase